MGVPFVAGSIKQDKQGIYLSIDCPACGTEVVCRKRKDFESFAKVEYVNHFNNCKAAISTL